MAQTGSMNYQALLAQTVAASPRSAIGQLYPYDFAVGHPAPEALPLQELSEATARALDREGRDLAHYLPAEGHLGLRQLIARKMALHERVHVDPDQIIVGNGSQQLIAMLIDCFVDPGDTVLVEEFTYVGTLRLLRRAKASIVGVPVDDKGMRTDCLEETPACLATTRGATKIHLYIDEFSQPVGG